MFGGPAQTDSVLCVLPVGQPGHSALVITARMHGRGQGWIPMGYPGND